MREKVLQLLEKALKDDPSLFLIDFTVTETNQIRITIDGDNGVTVEDCIKISRAIEHNLDREEEDFSLEVMSAGVSQPLTAARQYKKNIGRKLKVQTEAGESIEGELTDATENDVTLKWKTREPKPVGKGKHTVKKEAVVPYNDIVEAKVMITFN
ncbi:ribosome assembly cofactor RimP [Marixanthomonas spongiae]|uniref:Ribosome maturation factor RimP n=1 Tax=Marixanthomonas spongiae TaxID=2174845 RepID=A0A2U0I847_9FLAO|nr:ribosome assembly cofactor RimP [Marixanthomonas spongiae]PVW17283.1 ribosome assembly cofactor RimP [Marixanthomonas spongiae]